MHFDFKATKRGVALGRHGDVKSEDRGLFMGKDSVA